MTCDDTQQAGVVKLMMPARRQEVHAYISNNSGESFNILAALDELNKCRTNLTLCRQSVPSIPSWCVDAAQHPHVLT